MALFNPLFDDAIAERNNDLQNRKYDPSLTFCLKVDFTDSELVSSGHFLTYQKESTPRFCEIR